MKYFLWTTFIVMMIGALYSATYIKTDGAATTMPATGLKHVLAGSETVGVLDTSRTVTFSGTLPTVNYELFLQAQNNVAVSVWGTAKTTTNFILNLSVGVNSVISYAAIER